MIKNRRYICRIMIALMLTFAMVFSSVAFSYAEGGSDGQMTLEEFDEAEKAKQKEFEEQQAESEDEIEASKQKSEEASKEAEKAAEKEQEFAAMAAQAESEIAAIQSDIDIAEAKLAETEKKLNAKKKQVNSQSKALNERLSAMYKTGSVGFVDIILNSDNVKELITNVGMVHMILNGDKELLQKLREDYKEIEALQAEQEEEQAALEYSRAEMQETKERYEDISAEYAAKRAEMEAEADRLAEEAAAKQAELEEMLRQEEERRKKEEEERRRIEEEERRRKEEEERRKAEEAGKEYVPEESTSNIDAYLNSTSGYLWPCNGEITQYFGNKWSIYSSGRHSGVDIGAATGTPIYAPCNGIISSASYGWNGGYGNLTTMYAGNGYLFYFGHQSSIAVSKNQYVSKGDIIGYVGNTGLSTGPHLHFELRINGVRSDPLQIY